MVLMVAGKEWEGERRGEERKEEVIVLREILGTKIWCFGWYQIEGKNGEGFG